MHVAIIGPGKVGSGLAHRVIAAGATVVLGARNPDKTPVADVPAGVRITNIADAVAGANIVLLAVPAAAAIDAAKSAGDLRGKILVDCTNPLRFDRGPIWNPPPEGSVAQALAAALPGVSVIKGFNQFGAEIHNDPRVAGGPADAFFAGDDPAAKRTVLDLAAKMGFRALDAGPLRNAGVLENLAVLWIHMAVVGGLGRQTAFRIEGRA